MIGILLQEGATQNYRSRTGCSPVMKAVGSRSLESVKLLLENKADLNEANISGMTPLMMAEAIKDREMMDLLKSYIS